MFLIIITLLCNAMGRLSKLARQERKLKTDELTVGEQAGNSHIIDIDINRLVDLRKASRPRFKFRPMIASLFGKSTDLRLKRP